MPIKRKKKAKQSGVPRAGASFQDGEFQLLEHPLSRMDRDDLKAALERLGNHNAAEVPELIKNLLTLLRDHYPPQVIATVAIYGSQGLVGNPSEEVQSLTKVEQHHIELLQGLALTLPFDEWGKAPATPMTIQAVMEALDNLGSAFAHSRIAKVAEEPDQQRRTVLGLQERIRTHTQVIRNWGYFGAVVGISRELYSALDEDLAAHHGFSASDVIEVAKAAVTILEDRCFARLKLLRKIFSARKISKLVRDYYALYPGVTGDPQDFIDHIPSGTPIQDVRYRLLGHADLSLLEASLLTTTELSDATLIMEGRVDLVMQSLSLRPAELESIEPSSLFLNNPVWSAPCICIGGEYFFPAPQLVFTHIHTVMRRLVQEADLSAKMDKRKAAYLESKMVEIISAVLPGDRFKPNAKWRIGHEDFETDLLGIIDRVVLIVEAKSASVTPQGLRGMPERVKRHVRDLVVRPAEQSKRLADLIIAAKEGDLEARRTLTTVDIIPEHVDTVIRLSVTLDDFSVLASAEPELKVAGWVPDSLPLAPTLSIADLQTVALVLKQPAYFLHYLAERDRTQKALGILGDEMDFLGLYLQTGFNIAGIEREGVGLAITGMSKPVDIYFTNADAGAIGKMPVPKIHPHLERIVLAVQQKKDPAWTTRCLDLLRMGNFKEQQQVFRVLKIERDKVLSAKYNPEEPSCLIVSPPSPRQACVVFYVHPSQDVAKRHEQASTLASSALEKSGKERCVIVGRRADRWHEPYSFVAITAAPGATADDYQH